MSLLLIGDAQTEHRPSDVDGALAAVSCRHFASIALVDELATAFQRSETNHLSAMTLVMVEHSLSIRDAQAFAGDANLPFLPFREVDVLTMHLGVDYGWCWATDILGNSGRGPFTWASPIGLVCSNGFHMMRNNALRSRVINTEVSYY